MEKVTLKIHIFNRQAGRHSTGLLGWLILVVGTGILLTFVLLNLFWQWSASLPIWWPWARQFLGIGSVILHRLQEFLLPVWKVIHLFFSVAASFL